MRLQGVSGCASNVLSRELEGTPSDLVMFNLVGMRGLGKYSTDLLGPSDESAGVPFSSGEPATLSIVRINRRTT
jgi:hypothetical protein